MPKVILYIATSQDGFIADNEGGVDWLPHPNDEHEDMGYSALMERISTIVMGARSYEQIIGFGEWAWKDKKTYVFSNQPQLLVNDTIHLVNENVADFMSKMDKVVTKDIWLLGGATLAKSFADQSLIDECIITVIPKKLRQGIGLDIDLEEFELKETVTFKQGILQRTYLKIAAV